MGKRAFASDAQAKLAPDAVLRNAQGEGLPRQRGIRR